MEEDQKLIKEERDGQIEEEKQPEINIEENKER